MATSNKKPSRLPLHDVSTHYLMLGLPSLAAMLAVTVLTVVILAQPEATLLERYTSEARRSMRAGEYDRAQECYARLLELNGDDPSVRFEVALLEATLGNEERAKAILSELASTESLGYVPAHIWWARRYLASVEKGAGPNVLQPAELHLQRAIEGDPDNAVAHVLLGRLYLSVAEHERAVQHLLFATRSLPEARLDLAKAYAASGRPRLAQEQARAATENFRQRVSMVSDDSTARIAWARAALFLNDYQTAVRVLAEGYNLSGDRAYREELGSVYASWSSSLDSDEADSTELALATVEQGLRYDPDNLSLLMHLLQLSRGEGAVASEAQDVIRFALEDKSSRATLHMLMGMDAQKRGEERLALEHYEAAYTEAPQLTLAANNLAWLLAHSEHSDLPRALEIINGVISQWPDQIDFRDTRGHILAKMGRWREALTDLELVAAARPGNAQLHKTLAELFEQADSPDAAAKHRRIAAENQG